MTEYGSLIRIYIGRMDNDKYCNTQSPFHLKTNRLGASSVPPDKVHARNKDIVNDNKGYSKERKTSKRPRQKTPHTHVFFIRLIQQEKSERACI